MIYERFLESFTDWRPETLYWQRFSIAEQFGKEEINRVYEEIFEESKNNYKLLTELVMVLNHKSWQHCKDLYNSSFCEFYSKLFDKVKTYALNNLSGNELQYYLNTTD